ncbi:MAG: ABC transporter permease [Planctomyces sp.]|nr:ABC transporter permease [Planctomyces sp.]
MNLLSIALKSIRQRLVASSLTTLSVALGVALMIAVLIINGYISTMFRETGTGYDLVVGPQGSRFQLVLSTIYRIEQPIENLPWRFYEQMRDHPLVERAIPIAIGDQTEEGQFPIVGTTPFYLTTSYGARGKKFEVAGENMNEAWDAVIGSEVARKNGWTIGSQFRLIHGGQDDHIHDERFTVRGVLARTNTPNDRSVFVNLEGFLMLAGHEKPIEEAIAREAAFFGESEEQIRVRYADQIRNAAAQDHSAPGHDHAHDQPLPTLQRQVTSILVICKGADTVRRAAAAMSIMSGLKERNQAIAVNPVQVMRDLMDNLLANVRLAVLILTGLIILVSGVGIFVSIYNSMADRRREIGIMRALGAQRRTVFAIILLESLVLCIGGGLLGLVLGHGMFIAGAPIIADRTGLVIDPWHVEPLEFVIIPALVVLGTFVGFLPAMTAYRTDVASALQQ